jgi:hypothetical protein
MYHHRNVMLSAAKHLVLRPFASLRVTHKCANLVWFDLAYHFLWRLSQHRRLEVILSRAFRVTKVCRTPWQRKSVSLTFEKGSASPGAALALGKI